MNVLVLSLIAPVSLGAILSTASLESSSIAPLFAPLASTQCQGDCQDAATALSGTVSAAGVAPGGGILAVLDKIASPASNRPTDLFAVKSQPSISITELTAPAVEMLYEFIGTESSAANALGAWSVPTAVPESSASAELGNIFGALDFAGSASNSLESVEMDNIATSGLDSVEFDENELEYFATEDSLNSDWQQNEVAGLDLNRAAAVEDDDNDNAETFDVKAWGDGVKRAANDFVDTVGSVLERFFATRSSPATTVSHVVRIEPEATYDQWN